MKILLLLLTLLLTCGISTAIADTPGWTDFTVSSFQKVASDGNCAFSPYSFAGALRLLDPALQGPALERLRAALKSEDSGPLTFKQSEFMHQGSVWLDHTIRPRDSFRTAMREMHAYSAALDFSNGKEAAAALNSWVDDATKGMIKKIVEPADLRHIALLLMDAVAVKAKWLSAGALKETKGEFHGVKKSASKTFLTAPAAPRVYLKVDKMQLVEIDMAGDEPVFGILVPDAGQKFAAWRKDLSAEKIRAWSNQAKPTELEVVFPAMDMRSTFDLKPLFESLGLGELFDSGSQLPGIAPGLSLSWAKQSAFFSADKEGVKAAAVTALAAAHRLKVASPSLKVDRPFVYYLTDKDHRHILFLGQKTEP